MTEEIVPGSVEADGHLRITFVPTGSDPKSVAVLTGATAKALTYSLKQFNLTTTEAVIDDPRLTLRQILQKRGKTTQSLEVEYVYGSDDDVAYTVLKEGVKGFLNVRDTLPNDEDFAVGQDADILTIECGKQRKQYGTENGVQTCLQTILITNVSQEDVALVA